MSDFGLVSNKSDINLDSYLFLSVLSFFFFLCFLSCNGYKSLVKLTVNIKWLWYF